MPLLSSDAYAASDAAHAPLSFRHAARFSSTLHTASLTAAAATAAMPLSHAADAVC